MLVFSCTHTMHISLSKKKLKSSTGSFGSMARTLFWESDMQKKNGGWRITKHIILVVMYRNPFPHISCSIEDDMSM